MAQLKKFKSDIDSKNISKCVQQLFSTKGRRKSSSRLKTIPRRSLDGDDFPNRPVMGIPADMLVSKVKDRVRKEYEKPEHWKKPMIVQKSRIDTLKIERSNIDKRLTQYQGALSHSAQILKRALQNNGGENKLNKRE